MSYITFIYLNKYKNFKINKQKQIKIKEFNRWILKI